jgi:hypothetical protein
MYLVEGRSSLEHTLYFEKYGKLGGEKFSKEHCR